MKNTLIKTLDLHGETGDVSRFLVKDFIEEAYVMKLPKVSIIHGGGVTLRLVVNDVLKNHPKVKSYKLNYFNGGETIVEINL